MRALTCVLLLTGCFHVRLNEKTAKADFNESVIVPPMSDLVVNSPCAATNTDLMNVRFSSNLGYAWLSVITFGLVNKVDVQYACAPQTGTQPEGNPTPGGP